MTHSTLFLIEYEYMDFGATKINKKGNWDMEPAFQVGIHFFDLEHSSVDEELQKLRDTNAVIKFNRCVMVHKCSFSKLAEIAGREGGSGG